MNRRKIGLRLYPAVSAETTVIGSARLPSRPNEYRNPPLTGSEIPQSLQTEYDRHDRKRTSYKSFDLRSNPDDGGDPYTVGKSDETVWTTGATLGS